MTELQQKKPETTSSEEPDVRGTLFLTLLFLAMTVGLWVIVYYLLLNR